MDHPENDAQYAGLAVNKGIEQPPIVNPYLKKMRTAKRRSFTASEYVEGIVKGDTSILSQAVTLVESNLYEHQTLAQEVIEKCLPHACDSVRVGITGVPGAGKSTFCAGRRWNDRLFISFDAIMENIPAYQTDIYRLGRAGSFKKWEIPARIVGYELLRRAVEARADIYFEHSGVNRPHIQLVENLKKCGYRTEMHFILCSLAVAEARAKAREQMTKRHTPPAIIAERYNLVDTYLQTYAAKVDSLYVYDSTENSFSLSRNYRKGILVKAA